MNLKKVFLSYLNVKLFKRRVNSFNLFIIKEILAVIIKFNYPKTLNIFKYYFDLSGHLQICDLLGSYAKAREDLVCLKRF